jgi:hypothetical protein
MRPVQAADAHIPELINAEEPVRAGARRMDAVPRNLQCCGSGMFIPDPDFYPFRISSPGSQIQKQQQKRGVNKNFVVKPFFVATNFTKLKIILFFKC